jgi:hypothetical protein
MKTINDLLPVSEGDLVGQKLAQIETLDSVSNVESEVEKLGHGSLWKDILSQELSRINELMDIDLAQIVSRAWVKLHELHKYADETRYGSTETVWVSLADHVIKSEHHPHLDFMVDEVQVAKLEFQITLALAMKGIKLKIQGGRIKAFRAGSCKGSGELELGGVSLIERESKEIDWGKEVSLGQGLLIY